MTVMRKSGRFRTSAVAATAAALVLGFAAGAPAAAESGGAQAVIANAGEKGTIDGSYIVVLKDGGFSATSLRAQGLAAEHKADVTRVYKHALNGFAAEMSEAEALELAADPAVKEVVQNETVELAETQLNPPSWGLDRIDQADLPLDSSYTYPDHAGEGVTAYIVDTGVRLTHDDFEGRASFGFDAFGGNGNDGNGHGTHVAGTVAGAAHGVAKEADIVAVKVLDDGGSGTIDSVVGGIDWVTGDADGPSVANMSLGGGANSVLDDAVRNSIDAGVTYAVAAGNDYGADASGTSPARVGEAITVASSTSSDSLSSFSNVGSVVDLIAPGSSITSAWSTGDSATNTISGTSMATPHVAGASALYLAENPSATPAEVSQALADAAVYGRISNVPSGTVNALLHVGDEGSGPPDPPDGELFTNGTNVAIEDHQTSESDIAVSGVGTLDGLFEVEVDIQHTWIGDLTIDVIAPDGSSWLVHDRSGGSTDDLLATYSINGTGLDADGTWTLSVHDNATYDQGLIDSWSLQF